MYVRIHTCFAYTVISFASGAITGTTLQTVGPESPTYTTGTEYSR